MKLDKIKFGRVVAHCAANGMSVGEYEVERLDQLIDMPDPEPQVAEQIYPKNENVERLMALMVEGTKKLEAIREHRAITGVGLKESKDAIERHWKSNDPAAWTLRELRAKLTSLNYNNDEFCAISHFLDKL